MFDLQTMFSFSPGSGKCTLCHNSWRSGGCSALQISFSFSSEGCLYVLTAVLLWPLRCISPCSQWISMKSRLVRAARETSKFHKSSLFNNSRRRYMAEILPIRRKTLYHKSIKTQVVQSRTTVNPFLLIHDLLVQPCVIRHRLHILTQDFYTKDMWRKHFGIFYSLMERMSTKGTLGREISLNPQHTVDCSDHCAVLQLGVNNFFLLNPLLQCERGCE